jgi:hypothetical protein
VREDLALAEVAWLTDRLLTPRHLIPNGLVVLLRAFQRALQEPDDSVLGLADTGAHVHQGLPGFRADGRAGDPRLLAARARARSSSLLVPVGLRGY